MQKIKTVVNTKLYEITANNGKVFVRIQDNFMMSNEIVLGYDYSIGVKRLDKA